MSFTFLPGNIVLDETTTNVCVPTDSPTWPVDWPDSALWLQRMRYWLTLVSHTGVGRALLDSIEARPATGPTVLIVRDPHFNDTYTDGPVGPGGLCNPPTPSVIIRFTPPDARSRPIELRAMRHPGSVIAHELTHALMGVHRLNSVLDETGATRPIASWASGAYPNHNEFCATTVQNMLLSEEHAVLSDGYHDGAHPGSSQDDPWISSTQDATGGVTPFGLAATTQLDMVRFVSSYRQPLDYLAAHLPVFVARLAALPHVPFNPFAQMLSADAGGTSAPTMGGGAARVPGPTELGPR